MAKDARFTRLVITSNDVQTVHGCSSSTAKRKIQLAKSALAKAEHQVLTIEEYCNYYGLDFPATIKILNT